MELRGLSDQQIVRNLKRIKKEEDRLLIDCLRHIREVERRKIYSGLKKPSLSRFMMSELGYSEDEAQRRIDAMRMLNEVPEIEPMIEAGSLTLTNIGLAKSLFKKQSKKGQAYSRAEKMEFLVQINGRSKRDVQKDVAAICPEALRFDSVRPISKSQVEVKFAADTSIEGKIEIAKGLLAHSHPDVSLGELLNMALDTLIGTYSALARKSSLLNPDSKAGIRRAVMAKANYKCENCGSVHALQSDHILPIGKGGPDNLGNQRAFCRNCNQWVAIKEYGLEKMLTYLEPKSPITHTFSAAPVPLPARCDQS